jgi:shikimate kinase
VKLYIIGFSSAGKSTLAKSLADRWSIPYWDTDEIFIKEYSENIADYVRSHGWPAFRKAESDILLKTQKLIPTSESFHFDSSAAVQYRGIVACGGGIVESETNRAFLAEKRLIWLSPPWELLWSRIRQSPSAFCSGKSEQDLYQDYRRRCTLYRSLIS